MTGDSVSDRPGATGSGTEAETATNAPAESGGDPLLTVEDVSQSFGDVEVLDGLSFDVERGSVVCVVGSNGSGKTTALRVVAGLLAPDGGEVRIASDSERPVGYLPQTPAFHPQFTVAETLTFYGRLAGTGVDVDAKLSTVGLQSVPDRRAGALSGGMTRLLGIAQATIGDPPLLVLDEPSSGLDPAMVEHISSVIGRIADDGSAVLLATHNIGAVYQMADRVLVLDDGHVVAAGSPDDLIDETGTETLDAALADLIERSGAGGAVSVASGGDEA
ncbi:ABC transporter ATP-binding protein [Halomicrobium urmianum]|uniref:ABC transporter ATP-binding protein n=1 Tax=Halomicrobium urmianum TaxID=1586233 RepID=UPI001CD9D73A|nr:ABC transporter ATP-binding protein [Halomicrobium urmianum]